MSSQRGSIRGYVVSHKLTKNRPSSRSVSQGIGSVIDVSAITETACASERVQKLLIGLKGRKFRKHPRIRGCAKRCIDGQVGSSGRQTVTSDRCGRLIHRPFPPFGAPCVTGVQSIACPSSHARSRPSRLTPLLGCE